MSPVKHWNVAFSVAVQLLSSRDSTHVLFLRGIQFPHDDAVAVDGNYV